MAGAQGTSTRNNFYETLSALIEEERGDINTTATGIVVSYDAKTQTATIQPKLSKSIGGEAVAAPELLSVPVTHARAGGIVLHKPLKKGDEVMLHFSQHPLDGRIEDDADQPVDVTGRMHHLSDGLAVPAAHSKGKQLPDLPADRMHLGTEDGKSGLQQKEDGTWDFVKNGDSLWKVVQELAEAFRDHIHEGPPNDKKPKATEIVTRIGQMKAT